MSRSQINRPIDLSRARVQNRQRMTSSAAAPQHTAGTQHRPAQNPPRPHNQPDPRAAARNTANAQPERTSAARRKKARKTSKRVWSAVVCVLLLLFVSAGAVYWYADSIMNESELGSLNPTNTNPQGNEETIVPPDMKGVKNILVLGLDYDSDDPIQRDKKHPNTDMIMYVRLNANEHTMQMIQFPRDIFVGQEGGNAGKINGILAHNVDAGNGLGALSDYIQKSFGLPIDNYVTIDIDGLKAVVDAFYGIEIYIPRDMRYYNETTHALEGELLQGWRTLNGEQCEFFLRYRQGLPRADIDRLVMQRQFYAALFRRLKTASVGDIVNLLPVAEYYLRTDISTLDLMSMAIEVSTMDGANISMGRIPVYAAAEKYNGKHSPVVVAKKETADFLNQYFRPADRPISAEQIGTPEWPTTGGATEVAMNTMNEVASEGMDAQHQN